MAVNVIDMLNEPRLTTVCAPMVRYSRLQFRTLVRKYNCDICFTPMILADSFVQSNEYRVNALDISQFDKPLIVQFAANNVDDFVQAAEIISPFTNGIDLNCGCPQKWALKEGIGASLLKKPQLVKDLVYQVRNRTRDPFTVSVKIRLLKDIQKTIELCQLVEKAGVSFITVHARTPQQRCEPIDMEGLKLIRDCVSIPMIANGDVKNLEDAKYLYETTLCDGVMSARGLLSNPGLFAGETTTSISCVQDWINITSHIPAAYSTMHHHLVFMLEKVLSKKEKQIFNNLQTEESVLSYIKEKFDIEPNSIEHKLYDPILCDYTCVNRRERIHKDTNDLNAFCLENLFI